MEGEAGVGMDHVRLNDIVLFAHLGVSEAERAVGQRIHIDLDLEADLARASRSDALVDTVNYEAVYQLVESVVEGSRHRLLEALAVSVIDRIFAEFPAIRIRIRVRKPNVPFAGSLASAEVELVRER
jgi:dihydroneopterin aldolase